jgi:hypothetical protein
MIIRALGILLVIVALMCGCEIPHTPAIVPTVADLAKVWVGEGVKGTLEYFRLELRPDGTGLLTVQYTPDRAAVAYRVVRTTLDRYTVTFDVEPADVGADPLLLKGVAVASEMQLDVGGVSGEWKREIRLQPYDRLMQRLNAVTNRAEAYTRAR